MAIKLGAVANIIFQVGPRMGWCLRGRVSWYQTMVGPSDNNEEVPSDRVRLSERLASLRSLCGSSDLYSSTFFEYCWCGCTRTPFIRGSALCVLPSPPSPNGIPPNNYTGLEQGPSRSTERDGRIIQWGDTMGGRAKGQTAAAQPY